MSLTVQAVNVALAVLALWLLKKVTEKKPLGRPIPGPKGWPIIGNLLDVPTEVEYKVFSLWKKKYGKWTDYRVGVRLPHSLRHRRPHPIECPRSTDNHHQLTATGD